MDKFYQLDAWYASEGDEHRAVMPLIGVTTVYALHAKARLAYPGQLTAVGLFESDAWHLTSLMESP